MRGVLALVAWAALAAPQDPGGPAWSRQLPARKPAWAYTPKMIRDTGHPLAAAGRLVFVGCDFNGALLALDAETGEERWRFYTGAPLRLAPVADESRVLAVSDDGWIYCLDPEGRLLWKFRGGPSDRWVLGHERLISAWPASARPAIAEGRVFFVAGYWPMDGIFVHALDLATGALLWTNAASRFRPFGEVRVVDGTVFVDGHHGSGAFDAKTGAALATRPPPRIAGLPFPETPGVKGTISSRAAAGDRLFVSTSDGWVYGFGGKGPPRVVARGVTEALADTAEARRIIETAGLREGYALVVGVKDASVVEGLLRESNLHVVASCSDAESADRVRRRLDARGLFDGHRLSVVEGEGGLPPYFASLVLSESGSPLDGVAHCVRPYGGVRFERGAARPREGRPVGADDWSHEFHDPANSLFSRDALVRATLGVLWYGGPAADTRLYFDGDVDHQSGHGINPQPAGAEIVDGRMILQGPGVMAAFDIYTGRPLWEAPIPRMYAFGGPAGGLGIHSKKHPEPWRDPEAMKAEVPPTHHCRASGFNYVSVGDGVYVAAAEKLLRLSLVDGRRLSEWEVPIAGERLCWGALRVVGDLIVATAFRPADLADAQAGHDGNGGDWAGDRMPMAWLLVLDRVSGKLFWSRKAAWGFLNRGLAVGNGKVFAADLLLETAIEKLQAAGRTLPSSAPQLRTLDLRTGQERWSRELDIRVQNLVYSEARDILLVPCRHLAVWESGSWALRRGQKNSPGRMRGLRGETGEVLWEVEEAPYANPHILIDDLIIDRWGYTFDLGTGKRHERTSPLTGRPEPWNFPRGGCNHLVACRHLVTWRTAYYDLERHAGVTKLHGLDAGCSPTLLAAGGVLNIPAFGTHHKRNRMTAMALVHRPENESWAEYALTVPAEAVPLRRAGFNFGAPGDHVAENGTVWLRVGARDSARADVRPKDVRWFAKTGARVASSGVIGATEISIPLYLGGGKRARPSDEARRVRVRLHFAEPEGCRPGERVFTVSLEGAPVLKDFDVVREAGGPDRPVVKEFTIEVRGALDIAFAALAGVALLSGVELEAE